MKLSDEVATIAHPPYAKYVWCDENNIYLELSGQHGPYVTKYALNEGGLSKALVLMRDCHRQQSSPIYTVPGVNPAYKARGDYSEAQRERAREVLKRLKIT